MRSSFGIYEGHKVFKHARASLCVPFSRSSHQFLFFFKDVPARDSVEVERLPFFKGTSPPLKGLLSPDLVV